MGSFRSKPHIGYILAINIEGSLDPGDLTGTGKPIHTAKHAFRINIIRFYCPGPTNKERNILYFQSLSSFAFHFYFLERKLLFRLGEQVMHSKNKAEQHGVNRIISLRFLPQLALPNPTTFKQKYRVFVNVRFAGSRKSKRVARSQYFQFPPRHSQVRIV